MSGSEEASLRKSNKEAAETRCAIVAAAADHIRRTGIAEASLSDVMAAAGLTHGGFYKHFRNREQLMAEALVAAGNSSADVFGKVRAEKGRNAALDSYLSAEHRDAGTPTCPMAALGSEAARSSGETRAAAAAVVEEMIDALSLLIGDIPSLRSGPPAAEDDWGRWVQDRKKPSGGVSLRLSQYRL